MTPTSGMTWPNRGDTSNWLQTTEAQSYWVIHCFFSQGETPEVIQMPYRETSETPKESSTHPIVIVYKPLELHPCILSSILTLTIELDLWTTELDSYCNPWLSTSGEPSPNCLKNYTGPLPVFQRTILDTANSYPIVQSNILDSYSHCAIHQISNTD
jgi:hypothetical protein